MKLLKLLKLLILCIVLILLIFRLFIFTEGFEDISQNTINDYNKFTQFYNQFMTNWKKAITTSIISDIPQEPLTSPSQVSSLQSSVPSQNDMNLYINTLSNTLNISFPPITDVFPEKIDTLPDIISRIPKDSTTYINALKWMNEQLEKAHSNLNITDNFEDMCQDITSCISNNPELLAKIAEAQINKEKDNILINEQKLSALIAHFFSNDQIQPLMQQNTELIKKTEDIQKQAESGQLANQFASQIANKENVSNTTYDIPKGGNALSELQKTNPEKYNQLKDVAPKLFSIKQLIEQINSTL